MIEIMEHLIPDKVKRTNNEVKMSSKVFFYILIWRGKEGSGHAASLDLRNRQYTEVPWTLFFDSWSIENFEVSAGWLANNKIIET